MKNDASSTNRQDVYSRITSQIVASLEQGVRPLGETVERRTRRWTHHAAVDECRHARFRRPLLDDLPPGN